MNTSTDTPSAGLLQKTAIALFEERKYAEAAEAYRRLLELKPYNLHALSTLGAILFQMGELQESVDTLERYVRLEPDNISHLSLAATATKALGKDPTLLLTRIIDAPMRKPLRDIASKMWAALLLGRPADAFAFRIEGLNVMDWEELAQLYRAPDLQAAIQALPPVDGGPTCGPRPLLYAGGDGVYAERFAPELIASALAHCPGCDFHLHVMNPGTYRPSEALSQFPKDRVSWSTEDMGPCDKILFSPRRYIRMSQFRNATNRTMILVDTDSVINGDIVKALPQKFDVVVYDRPDQSWAHQMVNGGFLAVAPTGKDFLDFVAAYILSFESRGIPKWFDDQFGIVSAREWFRYNVADVSIDTAPPHMMNVKADFDPACLIWHFKGPQKLQGPGNG